MTIEQTQYHNANLKAMVDLLVEEEGKFVWRRKTYINLTFSLSKSKIANIKQ